MLEKDKKEIERMRRNGASYKAISELLGISINTIISHCTRHDIKKEVVKSKKTVRCLNCKAVIIQREKVKKRKFCCDECRTKWWNSHPEEVTRRANYQIRCAACGKEFISYGNKHRKYCSHSCYINDRFNYNEDSATPSSTA